MQTRCGGSASRQLLNPWVAHAAGLHQGLESLVEGGVPPRFLIIDDGWQNTDVDKRFRTPPTSRSMPKNKQMQDASDEYFGAEIEVLADAKKDIPPSSSAGALMPNMAEESRSLVNC
jgi:Raffinose synthase or seed imbibition protein Sip1